MPGTGLLVVTFDAAKEGPVITLSDGWLTEASDLWTSEM
jgi:hypothetical protein